MMLPLSSIIMSNPPAEAVRACIRAYPEALVQTLIGRDWSVQLPPWLLAFFNLPVVSIEILRTILQEICLLRSDNSYYRNGDFQNLLCPFMILEKCGFWENTFPLDTMRVILEELHLDLSQLESKHRNVKSYISNRLFDKRFVDEQENGWEKLNLVLMKLTKGVTREDELQGDRFLALHAGIEVACMIGLFGERYGVHLLQQVFQLVKEHDDPEQFQMRNREGLLPLHVATTYGDRGSNHDMHLESSPDIESIWYHLASNPDPDQVTRFHNECLLPILMFLLTEYPESGGIADGNGDLPLHLATEHCLSCCQIIADAEPRALTTRSIVSRMYPFQLAALGWKAHNPATRGQKDTTVDAVNMTYILLRKAPHVLQTFLSQDEPWMDSPEFKEIQQNKLQVAKLLARNATLKRKVDAMRES